MSKVVLVTGGSSGIGQAVCQFLADKGYVVYGSSRSATAGEMDGKVKRIALDITSDDSVNACINTIVQAEGRIDVLVNNAGLGIAGSIEETSVDEVKTIFETNVFGTLRVIQAVIPIMREQASGYIINVSSIGGLMGLPFRGIYSSSKFAVEGFTEALSLEVARFGIKTVLVEPGDFNTNINENRYETEVKENSPYLKDYGRILQIIQDEVKNGKDPQIIGEVIYKIINTRKPRLHYKVGTWTQRTAVKVKRLFSDRFDRRFERILKRHYKL
jgi:NAD(P)-dependent dehydrogenase (short-subunit alcohol dehydrogenase family)